MYRTLLLAPSLPAGRRTLSELGARKDLAVRAFPWCDEGGGGGGRGGEGGGAGGGYNAGGGGGKAIGARGPQSLQSAPYSQQLYSDPGPPSAP